MSAHESIRHILKQVAAAGKQAIDAGDASAEHLDVLRSFTSEVEKAVAKLDKPAAAINKQVLFQDLLDIHGRCTGPLERFRGQVEDALSLVETITA